MLSETFVRNYLLQGRVSIQAFLSNNLSNYYLIKNLIKFINKQIKDSPYRQRNTTV